MFYSHEILTSRKHGVATVWLVATLGAKSSTRKVTRKAILDVDVLKACETIMEPEAPMALRLQSNLLYGVSRVYDQQCYYVLQDAQTTQNAIRILARSNRNDQLDSGAGKARPEQLVLADDPAFSLDNALPPINFDFLNFDIHNGDTQRSTQSMLSIRHRSGSASSRAPSVFGLDLPSSSHGGGYQLPMNDPFDDGYVHKDFGGLGRDLDEEDLVFQDDLGFGFNEHGDLVDGPVGERIRMDSVRPEGHPPSSAASGRVRREHEQGRAGGAFDENDEFNPVFGDDDMGILPDAEPFGGLPMMSGGLGGNDQPQRHPSEDRVRSISSEDDSSISSAQAPQIRRTRTKKGFVIDKTLEITSREMKAWQTEYLAKMTANNLVKANYKANMQAKKNAFHFVLGAGLNGVGEGIGSSKFISPLAMFSGESLLALVTGRELPGNEEDPKQGTKRAGESREVSPNKRVRESEQGRGTPAASAIRQEEESGFMVMDDDLHSQSIELGRDAGSILPEVPSSVLPWNMSASANSFKRNPSGSLQSRIGILGSQAGGSGVGRGTRISASPLIGRGSHLPLGELDQFSLLHERDSDAPMQYGREDDNDNFGSQGLDFGASSQVGGPSTSQQAAEFEIFGQAASVDTQTAAQSQWVRDALDKESNNFFEYVRNSIEEKSVDELAADVQQEGKFVTFEELFETEGNSKIVAAQAFYHILCLATKRRVWVEQDTGVDDGEEDVRGPEPWGEIRIGVIVVGA